MIYDLPVSGCNALLHAPTEREPSTAILRFLRMFCGALAAMVPGTEARMDRAPGPRLVRWSCELGRAGQGGRVSGAGLSRQDGAPRAGAGTPTCPLDLPNRAY